MTDMPASKPPFTLSLIVAHAKNLGIGHNGTLPWRLRAEMQYFKRVTTRPISPEGPQNAVIMGRKTWESIPERFRPLQNRHNVILTRSGSLGGDSGDSNESVETAKSLDEAILGLKERYKSGKIGRVFVIGGAEVYRIAMEAQETRHVLVTLVQGDWDCDTFFPVDLDKASDWEKATKGEWKDYTGEETQHVEEGDVKYEYLLYKKT